MQRLAFNPRLAECSGGRTVECTVNSGARSSSKQLYREIHTDSTSNSSHCVIPHTVASVTKEAENFGPYHHSIDVAMDLHLTYFFFFLTQMVCTCVQGFGSRLSSSVRRVFKV